MDYNEIVPVPPKTSINTALSALDTSRLQVIFGQPGHRTRNCSEVSSAVLRASIVTASVGPFNVTGHRTAVVSLTNVLREVKHNDRELFDAIRYDGMLCVRSVRSSSKFSNHAWGFAVDLQFGELDEYGSSTCHKGLLELYPYFHSHRWYWGAGFPRKDPMHFEPSNQLFSEWLKTGMIP